MSVQASDFEQKTGDNLRTNHETEDIAPANTIAEHLQRVEEWTQKSLSLPPSNQRKSAKQYENEDLEAKSHLIVEAVRLLDTRERQQRSKPTNMSQTNEHLELRPNRGAQSSTRTLNGELKGNVKPNNDYDSTPLRPSAVPKLTTEFDPEKKITYNVRGRFGPEPFVEPESWKFKSSRAVKFTVVPGRSTTEQSLADGLGKNKPENDPDWWRWKLRQRVIQNDELFTKLVSQGRSVEGSFKYIPTHHYRPSSSQRTSLIPTTSSSHNGSQHVKLEIPMPKLSYVMKKQLNTKQLTKDPIPNFYTPSKQILSMITATNEDTKYISASKPTKTLKKDPYLSKLLSGTKLFKPETMLNINQSSHGYDHDEKSVDAKVKHKISLESLAESDDEIAAIKFFNPDVKILYERITGADEPAGNKMLYSREPSDGFLDLPSLLVTGRFNRYNKYPSMRPLDDKSKTVKSKKASKRTSTFQAQAKNPSHLVNKFGLVKEETSKIPEKVENLPTDQWAKMIMSRLHKEEQTPIPREVKLTNETEKAAGSSKNMDSFGIFNSPDVYGTKPIDKEMNNLYHEILMSKGRKEKYDTNTRRVNLKTSKRDPTTKFDFTGVRAKNAKGVDIWLENIREKAKRDHLISPHQNEISPFAFVTNKI